jgi:hypothetical protein
MNRRRDEKFPVEEFSFRDTGRPTHGNRIGQISLRISRGLEPFSGPT